ncbi:MAG TPA: FAD-binding oxidoreductase [Actinomycetota bacterium]|nr:FAD-binding oxidoreductase [Actinomycetota bacterium]
MSADRDLTGLSELLQGELILPGDPDYEGARRLWNGVFDPRPAAIARCLGASDVAKAVRFGRELGLPIAIRGGGHNVAGTGSTDGGLVLDLSTMRTVTVDPTGRTVVVEGGATLGDVDAATQTHGLAVPFGVVSETGVAGLTLSGGMGWLRRRHGLTCDNLIRAEVVTADGEVVTASEDADPDLLWGLRGGGGNFGVVSSFTFRSHPVGPNVFLCFVLYPAEHALGLLGEVRDFTAAAPDEVAPIAFLGRVPEGEAFPAEAHGRPFAAVACVHPDGPAEGERALRPLRELGEPIVDLSDALPYVEAQRLLDEDYPTGRRYYWKSIELAALSDDAIQTLMGEAEASPSEHSTIDVWFQGGAMAAVAPDATAYGDRSAPILIGVEANWEGAEHDDANIAWARGCVEDLRSFSTGGTYLNFPGFLDERDAQVQAAYGANLERLRRLKRSYDPDNVFRINHNVAPAPA